LFAFGEPHEFVEDERAFLGAIARQCAHAIEKIRLVESVRKLYAAEAEARRQAEAANRAKDEFLAMLGHELRNPLAPIVTALSLMKLRGVTGEIERERAIAERQAHQLVRLVDDLLDVSRVALGTMHLKRTPVDVADAVAQALEATGPLVRDRDHRVEVDIAPGLVVDADDARLVQVLANLVTNAAKYTPRHGHIRVRGEPDGNTARITVQDNGIGMPVDLLPRVFDAFVQATRTTDRADGGLGLGLAIVKNIVTLHGGRVAAASQGPGCGAELTVWWPLSVQPAATAEPAPERGTDRALKVLVVDDNVDAATTLGELLRALGHEPIVVYDATSALAYAEADAPELALVDIGLPVVDGYELAHRLRALPGLADTRLVAVSGYGQPSDRARTRDAGFAEHLVKPVGLDDLRALLVALRAPIVAPSR